VRRHSARLVRARRVCLTAIAVLLASAARTPLAAQSRDTTVRLGGTAVVDVTLRTGRLVVRGIEGPTGAVRGGGRDYQLRPSGVGMVVNGRGAESERGSPLELDLPRGVRLVVNTMSADVDLRDLRGDVDVRTMTGDVRGDALSGRVFVETLSGNVDVVGAITQLRASTVSGDVITRGTVGRIDVRTTSGDIDLRGGATSQVTVQSMSGDVQFDGALADDARVQIGTHSGNVSVRVPESARGQLELSTVTGELDAGGPLTLMPGDLAGARRGRATQRYQFNGGGAMQLDISTFSGDVRLVRGTRP
jgi:hypothetical protein